MRNDRVLSAADRFAFVLGIFLMMAGLWGLFRPVVFGLFTTNLLHAMIHLGLGVAGVLLAQRTHSRRYLKYVGGLLLVVGVLRFLPGTDGLVVRLLAVNVPGAILNILLGVTAQLLATRGYGLRRQILA